MAWTRYRISIVSIRCATAVDAWARDWKQAPFLKRFERMLCFFFCLLCSFHTPRRTKILLGVPRRRCIFTGQERVWHLAACLAALFVL